MATTVYNIVWADDEIDSLLSEKTEYLHDEGFNLIAKVHTADELQRVIVKNDKIDAVISDFNFGEHDNDTLEERDCSGFDKARHIYDMVCEKKIPFFLYTKRSDEFIRSTYKNNPKALDDFKRHERWFFKGPEFYKMMNKIKDAVVENKRPSFIVRNKYHEALNCATLNRKANEELFPLLLAEHENCLEQFSEPFVTCRKIIEEVFKQCEECKLIPPISEDVNGTSKYFSMDKYSGDYGSYENKEEPLMKRPLARALYYLIDITQDGAHNKKNMKLKVDEYWQHTKDTYLLRSILFITCDILKWFAQTFIDNQDKERNALRWDKINTALQAQCKEGK